MAKKYTAMNAGAMLEALADDGMKWAEAFHEQFPAVSVEDAFGWFANAIENTWDVRCSRLSKDEGEWLYFQERMESLRLLWREIGVAS